MDYIPLLFSEPDMRYLQIDLTQDNLTSEDMKSDQGTVAVESTCQLKDSADSDSQEKGRKRNGRFQSNRKGKSSQFQGKDLASDSKSMQSDQETVAESTCELKDLTSDSQEKARKRNGFQPNKKTLRKICPVKGCTSKPQINFSRHLTSKHFHLTADQRRECLRTAAVWQWPSPTRPPLILRKSSGNASSQFQGKDLASDSKSIEFYQETVVESTCELKDPNSDSQEKARKRNGFQPNKKTLRKICPVKGCTSKPQINFSCHLTSKHPHLTADQRRECLRTAAVWQWPSS